MKSKTVSTPPTQEQKQLILQLHEQHMSSREIVKATGISRYYVKLTLNEAGKSNSKLTKSRFGGSAKEGFFDWNHKDFRMYHYY